MKIVNIVSVMKYRSDGHCLSVPMIKDESILSKPALPKQPCKKQSTFNKDTAAHHKSRLESYSTPKVLFLFRKLESLDIQHIISTTMIIHSKGNT